MTRYSPLHGLLSQAEHRKRLAEVAPPPPDDIHRWLAKLVLLNGVPFEYLVPDERMLPAESIRFFFVDENWIERLIDGALSVVGRTELQQLIHAALRTALVDPVKTGRVAQVRQQQLGHDAEDSEPLVWPLTGFLLRSVIVDHWKGIEVENTAKDDSNKVLTTLRLDRPAQGVLLGLYNGPLGSVTFKHPPESLHFGIDGQEESPPDWKQALRRLDTGLYYRPDLKVDVVFRDRDARVIDVVGTANAFNKALNPQPPKFTSSELAIEMIESPKFVKFEMLYPS